jgi:3-oxoacyl-[acyl-carrier protein] reductase
MPLPKPLDGKLALVTGGGIGIGAAIATAFAKAGATVAITYRTHPPSDDLVVALTTSSGSRPIAIEFDAGADADLVSAAKALSRHFETLDILVNNIGGLVRRSTIADMPYSLWREVMAVNLDSAFLVSQHFLPIMSRHNGRIINIASLAGRNGGHPGATAYASSKAALFGFTRGLAKELASEGITVNALAPGFIEATPFHDTFTSTESKLATVSSIPVGRAGTPQDVASAALWLASDDAAFVTGAIIDINGGQYFG